MLCCEVLRAGGGSGKLTVGGAWRCWLQVHQGLAAVMADAAVIDLTGDEEDGAPTPPAPAATQQQVGDICPDPLMGLAITRICTTPTCTACLALQDTHVVAVYCGEKGLAVCGVRADLRQKRPARQYMVLDFQVVTDAGYLGPSRTPPAVLAGMVQR